MRWAWATLLLSFACAQREAVSWPPPDPDAPHQLLLLRLPDGSVELSIFEPEPQFSWALSEDDAWVLLRFDEELDRVLLDRDGPRIRLGDVALPPAKHLWSYELGSGLRPVDQLPEWAAGLAVAPACPELQGQRISLPASLRTTFSGPPGRAYVAYFGGVAEISLQGAQAKLWPQTIDVTAGVWSGGRLWVGLNSGKVAQLDPASGIVGPASAEDLTPPVNAMAAAPDGTLLAVDGALVTWWSQGAGPFERGPTLELPPPLGRCGSQQVLLSWWAERSAFLATYRASLTPATASRSLLTVNRTAALPERLSPDLGAIKALFSDDRGEPVILGQSTALDPLNPQARAVIRYDPDSRQWRAQRPLGIPFYDALGARGVPFGFVYVGLEGLIAAFRDYGGTCSPEPILGGGDFDGLVPLDEQHSLASGCGQEAVFLVESR